MFWNQSRIRAVRNPGHTPLDAPVRRHTVRTGTATSLGCASACRGLWAALLARGLLHPYTPRVSGGVRLAFSHGMGSLPANMNRTKVNVLYCRRRRILISSIVLLFPFSVATAAEGQYVEGPAAA